jgi:competence protein ComEC
MPLYFAKWRHFVMYAARMTVRPVPPIFWLIPCVLALATLVAWRETELAAPGGFQVHFLDVGQGDSALLVTPSGKQILIDGGPDLSALRGLGRYMPLLDRSIDLLVLSHSDSDHVFALPDVLKRYRVGSVLLTGAAAATPKYNEFLTLLQRQRIPLILADPARDIALGDEVTLDVLWPRPGLLGVPVKDPNNASILLRAQYGSSSILFTGDMELSEEREILSSRQDIHADVLKVGHHGSKTSSSTGFLLAVKPSLAVISVGAHNTYGHPSPSVVERFRQMGIPVRSTAQEGDITLSFQ